MNNFYVEEKATTHMSNSVKHITWFHKGSLPLLYLGVPLFKGIPRAPFFNHLTNKVKTQLQNWKGKMLSMTGRMQLVNFVMRGLLNYSFKIYKWPKHLIKDMERWIRNFIWCVMS